MPYRNELYHHGIKGMKWGIRRFQKKNGSLTSAGRKRTQSDEQKSSNRKKTLKKVTIVGGAAAATAALTYLGTRKFKSVNASKAVKAKEAALKAYSSISTIPVVKVKTSDAPKTVAKTVSKVATKSTSTAASKAATKVVQTAAKQTVKSVTSKPPGYNYSTLMKSNSDLLGSLYDDILRGL